MDTTGRSDEEKLRAFGPITMGDRVGAGPLTTLILVGWWRYIHDALRSSVDVTKKETAPFSTDTACSGKV